MAASIAFEKALVGEPDEPRAEALRFHAITRAAEALPEQWEIDNLAPGETRQRRCLENLGRLTGVLVIHALEESLTSTTTAEEAFGGVLAKDWADELVGHNLPAIPVCPDGGTYVLASNLYQSAIPVACTCTRSKNPHLLPGDSPEESLEVAEAIVRAAGLEPHAEKGGDKVVIRRDDRLNLLRPKGDFPPLAQIAGELKTEIELPADKLAEAMIPKQVANVRASLKALAKGVDIYHLDYNEYPAYTVTLDQSIYSSDATKYAAEHGQIPQFRMRHNAILMTLTTPITYIPGYGPDPFLKDIPNAAFAYWTNPEGWILWSPGPDGKYDIRDPQKVSSAGKPQPSDLLLFTYDPTNGTISGGDIWEVKQ
jgi:hypothetical protein